MVCKLRWTRPSPDAQNLIKPRFFHIAEDFPMPTDENRRLDCETMRNSARHLELNRCA